MSTPEPIHVAFVWHMHQPYYRSARTGAFQMPWVRMHALKDYLDMVEILAAYPAVRQTFNLVPSLLEQLEDYVSGAAPDVYWERTIRPAAELSPDERAFIVERMCERSSHPRAKSHPRYLELAHKREAEMHGGWKACGETFSIDELRDLQIWFNLAWFDPTVLEAPPLAELVQRGRDYREEDKSVLAEVQGDILARVIPAYKQAANAGRIEVSTSPYFHPILPLLANSDVARVGAGDVMLPHRRFAHPEDAWEQVDRGVRKHERIFGTRPRGMWCSEQAVGEEILPLLLKAGVVWTISDETVLSRSVSGSATRVGTDPAPRSPYTPHLLRREQGDMAIVFRDHTLSDLVGFGYQSWSSRDAANDLLRRIRAIGAGDATLITIALDGENAWEYYPRDGRDFLHYLYEGLSADPGIRCVTVSEHLDQYPAVEPLDWIHTGSWIGGDLRTWSGDPAHNEAWDLLHDARDLAASRRSIATDAPGRAGDTGSTAPAEQEAAESAWRHILVAEGSDWFWWFSEHHHTELDYVWDLEFRQHLQEVYRRLGEPTPSQLYLPVLAEAPATRQHPTAGSIQPVIDGLLRDEDGWSAGQRLSPDRPSTMQRAEGTVIAEARFGWDAEHLYLLLVPRDATDLKGLKLELGVLPAAGAAETVFEIGLTENGRVEIDRDTCGPSAGTTVGAWKEVLEVALPLNAVALEGNERLGLVLRVGREGAIDHVFHSAGLVSLKEPMA